MIRQPGTATQQHHCACHAHACDEHVIVVVLIVMCIVAIVVCLCDIVCVFVWVPQRGLLRFVNIRVTSILRTTYPGRVLLYPILGPVQLQQLANALTGVRAHRPDPALAWPARLLGDAEATRGALAEAQQVMCTASTDYIHTHIHTVICIGRARAQIYRAGKRP